MERERFGTTTPLYHKQEFNPRGQMVGMRLSTVTTPTDGDRGAIINNYETTANNGNVIQQTTYIPGSNHYQQNFTYDSLNRLKSVIEKLNGSTDSYNQTYDYDRYGNRTINGAATFNAPEPQFENSYMATANRLYSPSENLSSSCTSPSTTTRLMCYDSAGNMIRDKHVTNAAWMSYDGENKMTRYDADDAQTDTTHYLYDADGKRKQTGSLHQVHGLGGELLAEPSGLVMMDYIYRNGDLFFKMNNKSSSARWLVKDHLGTPRIVADISGNLSAIKRHDYLPFGEEIASTSFGRSTSQGYGNPQSDGVRQQFTGYERDAESGLDFAQARMNSSNLGRFTSPDPAKMLKERMTDPQHWNLYVYARNNPLLFIDPSGDFPWTFFVRSFIQTSAAAQSGGSISGDGRVASLATDGSVTSRIQANFTIDYDNGKITNAVARSDPSTFYGVGGVGQETRTSNAGMAITLDSSRLSSGSRSEVASLHYAGKLPFGPSSAVPDIDVHARIGITETKTKYGNGSLSINGSVAGDTYPSNESFVVDQSGKGKVFLGAKLEEGGPGSLYGDNRVPKYTIDMKINFDKNGNFTSVVSGGKTYKVDDWNKKVQREF